MWCASQVNAPPMYSPAAWVELHALRVRLLRCARSHACWLQHKCALANGRQSARTLTIDARAARQGVVQLLQHQDA